MNFKVRALTRAHERQVCALQAGLLLLLLVALYFQPDCLLAAASTAMLFV